MKYLVNSLYNTSTPRMGQYPAQRKNRAVRRQRSNATRGSAPSPEAPSITVILGPYKARARQGYVFFFSNTVLCYTTRYNWSCTAGDAAVIWNRQVTKGGDIVFLRGETVNTLRPTLYI